MLTVLSRRLVPSRTSLGHAASLALGVGNDAAAGSVTMAALVFCLVAGARADVFISDGDRIGRYDNAGALIDPQFVSLSDVTGLTIGPDGYLYAATSSGAAGAPGVLRYDLATGAQIGSGPFVSYNGMPPTPDPRDVIDPQGLQFGPGGHLYVADLSGSTSNVHVYDSAGVSVGSLNSPTPADPGGPLLIGPRSVAFDTQQRLYVTSTDSVLRYDPIAQAFTTFTQSGPGTLLNDAKDIAFGPDQKLYVLDWSVATPDIIRFNADGSHDPGFLVDFAPTTFYPAGLTFGPDGKIYVSGYDALGTGGEVLRFNLDGSPDGVFIGSGGAGSLTYRASFMVITPEPSAFCLTALAAATWLFRRRSSSFRNG